MDKNKKKKEEENDLTLKDIDLDSEEALTKFKYQDKTIKEIIEAVKNQKQFDNFTWTKENNNILLNDDFGKDIEVIFVTLVYGHGIYLLFSSCRPYQ